MKTKTAANSLPGLLDLNTDTPGSETLAVLEQLRASIKGQDRALKYIVDAWEIYKSDLRIPGKPIFVGLFLGPSGVGKTLVAEVMAEVLLGERRAFTKVRCAEYVHGHEVAHLTGAPPGYIGHTTNPTQLLLSQFNIDKFDLLSKLQSGKLIETMRLSAEQTIAPLKQWKKEWGAQLIKLLATKKEDAETRKETSDLTKQIRMVEQRIETEMRFLTRIEHFLKGGNAADLSSETLLQIHHDCRQIAPFISIVLFDEVEKAHPDFHKHLLEIMDRGVLGVGNEITSFSNSFIFLTANVGSREIARILGQSDESIGFKKQEVKRIETSDIDQQIYKVAMEAAEREFRPEFLGRIDKIVVFRPLNREALKEILDLEISKVHHYLVKAGLPILVHFTDPAKNQIVEEAARYSSYGARMIEKKVDRILKIALARAKNQKLVVAGDVVWVDYADGKFAFGKELKKITAQGSTDVKLIK